LRNVEQNKGGRPSTEKDFETQHSGVFAAPGLPLAPFSTAESGRMLAIETAGEGRPDAFTARAQSAANAAR
jgi:hypothetical protein